MQFAPVCNISVVIFLMALRADYESNTLFWVDAKLHHIACSDLLGKNQRIVMTSYQHLKHPFAIAVFEVTLRCSF
jgi:Low-density lipoprotein receptor repeat class B